MQFSNETVIRLTVLGTLIIYVLDVLLASSWNRAYFTLGLPIFVRRLPVTSMRYHLPEPGLLEAEFQKNSMGRSLAFKAIDANQYFFRDRVFELRRLGVKSNSIMHGTLRYDPASQQVVVVGLANLTLPAFLLLFIGLTIFTGAWSITVLIVLTVLLVLFGVLYALQSARYAKIAELAVQSAETKIRDPWANPPQQGA
jgi:hypothetical protein